MIEPILPVVGTRAVEGRTQEEENHVGGFAADVVGCARPEKSPGHVEEGEQPDEARGGGGGDAAFEHFLDHGGGLAQYADAGGDVEEKHRPEEIKLGGGDRLIGGDVGAGDEFGGRGGGEVVGGLPTGRGKADGEDAPNIMKAK